MDLYCRPTTRVRRCVFWAVLLCLSSRIDGAQELTGSLFGTVKDTSGGYVQGALVRVTSPALLGGPRTVTTAANGEFRFPVLPPGRYTLEVTLQNFKPFHEADIAIAVDRTLERPIELSLDGFAESIVVGGTGSRIDARQPGFASSFGPDVLSTIPKRRAGQADWTRSAPGVSATSPSSGTVTTISVFGSGTNENQFLLDGTNMTCPCNGVARAEPGVDFISEVQLSSLGASAEFGNMQGAVVNVVTRQGGNRFLYDMSYYGQPAKLTSQPVTLPYPGGQTPSGYTRSAYRDFTSTLGGPAIPNHLWFFGGYQYLRDANGQPGTDPALPRSSEQNKSFGKLTWRFGPKWQLVQSIHHESWVNPEQPTFNKPYETTLRLHATVPAITFGELTHTVSPNTFWQARVGRFVYSRLDDPASGDRTTPNRTDRATNIQSGGPQQFGSLTLIRTTTKATVTHYRPGFLGGDHQSKAGGQFERGEHRSPSVIPSGVRYEDRNNAPVQSVSSAPSNSGGVSITASGFVSDEVTLARRVTMSAGLRYDYSRAISQDLPVVDQNAHETGEILPGLGTMYSWSVWSPRLGVTARLTDDGRTMLRASYGRFSQGVLTGEIGLFHPAVSPTITRLFDPTTGDYTGRETVDDNKVNLRFDPGTRAPHTDEYSVGVDREIRWLLLSAAFVHKRGGHFIGWTDTGGQYEPGERTLANGQVLPVWVLTNETSDRRFLLTNQDDYALKYDGLVLALEKRQTQGWHASGSYTFSRTSGLQPSSGAPAAGAQVSTVAPPPAPLGVTFGRDPNDLTHASGRLPNDRPHMFQAMGSYDVPRVGVMLAADFQHVTGKPWAASANVLLPQAPQQRILLEERGTRRLSSQSLLNLRVSTRIPTGDVGRVELMFDVLNVLNDTAEESLANDNLFSPTFGQAGSFVDPRRVMLGVRVNLGR